MDIQVTFENGTTELRPANCPSLATYDPTAWHPRDFTEAEVVNARPAPAVFFKTRGERRGTHALDAWREGDALVWCITGQDPQTRALTGEWRRCYAEAWWEQIARLTRERDAARRIAALDRVCLDTPLHAEMTALVRQAKKEGWL